MSTETDSRAISTFRAAILSNNIALTIKQYKNWYTSFYFNFSKNLTRWCCDKNHNSTIFEISKSFSDLIQRCIKSTNCFSSNVNNSSAKKTINSFSMNDMIWIDRVNIVKNWIEYVTNNKQSCLIISKNLFFRISCFFEIEIYFFEMTVFANFEIHSRQKLSLIIINNWTKNLQYCICTIQNISYTVLYLFISYLLYLNICIDWRW